MKLELKIAERGDSFVGIRAENQNGIQTVSVTFPMGYRKSQLASFDEKTMRRNIRNLILVLDEYGKQKEGEISSGIFSNQTKEKFPVSAAFFLIQDFLKNGYYTERRTEYKIAQAGKINWQRTIKNIRPVATACNDIVYLDYVVQKSRANENELISLIHKFCVHKAFSLLGFLFTSFVPARPDVKFNRNLFISVLKNRISRSFSQKSNLLFFSMISFLEETDFENENLNFVYGTNSFENVFEYMIDKSFGIKNKEKYYPKCHWTIKGRKSNFSNDIYRKFSLRPDTIMISEIDGEENYFVLDSKYYRFGDSGNEYDLPGTDSIIKQISYAEFIENKFNIESSRIFNAFILPADLDGKSFEYFGFAECDSNPAENKNYNKIHGLLIDMYSLIENHSKSEKKISELVGRITLR